MLFTNTMSYLECMGSTDRVLNHFESVLSINERNMLQKYSPYTQTFFPNLKVLFTEFSP